MTITVREFLPAVETAEAVRYEDPAQAEALAAWSGGRVVDAPGAAGQPSRRSVTVTTAAGTTATCGVGQWLVRTPGGLAVLDDAPFRRKWTATA